MTDWRETGERLKREWFDLKGKNSAEFNRKYPDLLEQADRSFVNAVFDFAEGRPKKLAEYLRSGRPLTPYNRDGLALAVEGKLTPQPKRGRPRNRMLQGAASGAESFYSHWRRENDQNDINDWGHRRAMMDESIQFALEFWPCYSDVDPEAVQQYINRPKSRRN
jgi:hypothetical protein